MKLPAPAGNAPAEPAMPPMAPETVEPAPTDDLDFGGETPTEPTPEMPEAPADDKPFDKEPFDAGIDVDEESDPKKFIEKLSGKIGQSLRDYTEKQGQPDFELEKFAINSLISATHTSEMDENDKNDIIKKINKAGEDDSENPSMDDDGNDDDFGNDNGDGDGADFGGDSNNNGEEDLEEIQLFEDESLFLKQPKRVSIFAPEGSPEFMEQNRITEGEGLWANIHAKRERGESPAKPGDKGYPDKKQWSKLTNEDENESESNNYMFWQNLKTIHHASGKLLTMDQAKIDEMVANGHAWAVDHISTSADDIEEVYHFMEANLEGADYDGETEGGYADEHGSVEGGKLYEGKYDDKPLGKPMQGDVKKFKVYVKNAKGNVVKVNFGDPNMEIKRDNPERKKAFRARHNCAEAKDRTTPKYWSCKMWSNTPVSKLVGENLTDNEKSGIFEKKMLKLKLQETFNQENMSEPLVEPIVKPTTKPAEPAPSRRNRPFTIEPDSIPQPDPKALNEGKEPYPVYHNTFSAAVQTAQQYAESKGYTIDENEWFNSVATGPKRPKEGQTNRYSISLYKDGKEQRKNLHIQVYGMGERYELNTYIA